jgi:putative ABC transport system substrate-binding protein
VAPSFGVELSPVNLLDAGEIERAVAAFARSPNSGVIVTASTLAVIHRELIVTLAARHKLPTVYSSRYFVTGGGLISYGPDSSDPHRRAGRVRRSHLKTAKTLGLDVPTSLIARADEVIE